MFSTQLDDRPVNKKKVAKLIELNLYLLKQRGINPPT